MNLRELKLGCPKKLDVGKLSMETRASDLRVHCLRYTMLQCYFMGKL